MSNAQLSAHDSRYYLLQVAHEMFGCTPQELTPEQMRKARHIVSHQRRIEEAVLHCPEAVGVVIPAGQIDAAWTAITDRYEDDQALQQALASNDLDALRIRGMLARELKVEAVLERISADVPQLSDTDASLYYFSHIEKFVRPRSCVARHILITINADFPENIRSAAQARIAAIAKRLRNKPTRFAEQALKHSECPTSLQGGLLGKVTPGMLYPELEAGLFELRPGQISPVLESPLGFHLLRCESIEPAVRMPLEEVLPRLRETLQARQRRLHQRQWLESLMHQQPTPVMESQSHG